MRKYTDISETQALSALLGKAPASCWALETVGYMVRLWEETDSGECLILRECKARSYAQAKQIAKRMGVDK